MKGNEKSGKFQNKTIQRKKSELFSVDYGKGKEIQAFT